MNSRSTTFSVTEIIKFYIFLTRKCMSHLLFKVCVWQLLAC